MYLKKHTYHIRKFFTCLLFLSFTFMAHFAYALKLDLLNNYGGHFEIKNGNRGQYLPDSITYDDNDRVTYKDNALILSIQNGKTFDKGIKTGHLVSWKTSAELGFRTKGMIQAKLSFKCLKKDKEKDKETKMKDCEGVWPGFWLTEKKYKAEIDIAEFMVHPSPINLTWANHIIYFDKPWPDYIKHAKYASVTDSSAPITYRLAWKCENDFSSCKLKFKQQNNTGSTITTMEQILCKENKYPCKNTKEDPWGGWQKNLIEGFEKGYHIVFTQQYNSQNPNDYNKFSNLKSEMLIHSIEINDEDEF